MDQRKHPVHHAPYVRVNRPTIVFVTICTQNRLKLLDNPRVHETLIQTWSQAQAWLVGRYIIMPDHVHLFASPGQPSLPLQNWIRYCKSLFTKSFGQSIWQIDHWDNIVRSGENYAEKWHYVRNNPVRAGLVAAADDWPYQGQLNALIWDRV